MDVEHGADHRLVDRRGRTPIHLAAYHGHLDACKLLVEEHAHLFARLLQTYACLAIFIE
jgi:ankyrin repeat protein